MYTHKWFLYIILFVIKINFKLDSFRNARGKGRRNLFLPSNFLNFTLTNYNLENLVRVYLAIFNLKINILKKG